jgi:hypothetical protein
MMIRGRHRGLPYALDRAITLPSDQSAREDADQEYRVEDEIGFEKENEKRNLRIGGRKMMKAYTQ